MSVKLTVERKVTPGAQRELGSLLRELRSKAVHQPGFISGETLLDVRSPNIFMTISTWSSIAAWEKWEKNPERLETIKHINALLQERPTVHLWVEDADAPPAAI